MAPLAKKVPDAWACETNFFKLPSGYFICLYEILLYRTC